MKDCILYTDKAGKGHAFYIEATVYPDEDGYTQAELLHVSLTSAGYDGKVLGRDSFNVRSDYGSAAGIAYDSVHSFIHCDSVPLEQRWQEEADREAAERRGW